MDKKTLSIILGLALLVSFFLPYLDFGYSKASGLDIVKSAGESKDAIVTYIWLLLPISGLMLLIGGLNKGNYPGGRSIWAWLPLLTLLFILIIYPMIQGMSIGNVFKSFGQGFGLGLWIALAAAVVAAFANPRN